MCNIQVLFGRFEKLQVFHSPVGYVRCKVFEDTGELSCTFQTEEKWGGLGLLQVGISLKFQEIKVIEIETPSSVFFFFFIVL